MNIVGPKQEESLMYRSVREQSQRQRALPFRCQHDGASLLSWSANEPAAGPKANAPEHILSDQVCTPNTGNGGNISLTTETPCTRSCRITTASTSTRQSRARQRMCSFCTLRSYSGVLSNVRDHRHPESAGSGEDRTSKHNTHEVSCAPANCLAQAYNAGRYGM